MPWKKENVWTPGFVDCLYFGANCLAWVAFVTLAVLAFPNALDGVGAVKGMSLILGVVFITVLQEGLHELGTQVVRNVHEAGGAIFAATNVALGVSILLVLIFRPRGILGQRAY